MLSSTTSIQPVYTNHVCFCVVDTLLQALERHPFDGKFGLSIVATVVVALVNITRQTKVGNFHHHVVVKPVNHGCS